MQTQNATDEGMDILLISNLSFALKAYFNQTIQELIIARSNKRLSKNTSDSHNGNFKMILNKEYFDCWGSDLS